MLMWKRGGRFLLCILYILVLAYVLSIKAR
jgi:hypothetical protein